MVGSRTRPVGKWSVTFPVSAGESLIPPDRSLTDGAEGELVTAVYMGVRGARIHLRVDAVTAQEIARVASSYRLLRYRVVPLLSIALIVSAVFASYAVGRLGSADRGAGPLIAISFVLFLGLLAALNIVLIGLAIPVRRRARMIPQYPHPSVNGIGNVVMRELDPDAAQSWIAGNPHAIQLID